MKIQFIKQILLQSAIYVVFFSSGYAQTSARQVTGSAGETRTAPGIVLTFVIGEPLSGPFPGIAAQGYLTAGLLQPEVLVAQLFSGTVRTITTYPNPTSTGLVKLDFKDLPTGNYLVDVVDGLGRIIFSKNVTYVTGYSTTIDLDVSRYTGGTYYLRIKNDKNIAGQAKLIKL